MFNVNKMIAREKLRRDAAIEQMKHSFHKIAEAATAPADAFEDAVRKQPLGACAISLGAGLVASSLVSSRTVAVPAAPQRVIVDLRNGTAETQKVPPQSNILELVMQALNLMGLLKPPAPPPMPPEPPQANGNGAVTANL